MKVVTVLRRNLLFTTILVLTAYVGGCGGGDSTPAGPSVKVPSIPANPIAAGGDQLVTVTWESVDNADSYHVYWSETSGTGTDGEMTNVSGSTFQHDEVTNGTDYFYVITAVNTAGQSDPSDEVSARPIHPLVLGAIGPLYFDNGANWNDYVDNDGISTLDATGTACSGNGVGYDSCLHGGEMRVVEVSNLTSCSGLTFSDSLAVFDWICDDSTSTARIISTGLKQGKLLSDLIDFTTPAWKTNSVTVNLGEGSIGSTSSTEWWDNDLLVDNDGIGLSEAVAGTVYLVTADPSANYNLDVNKLALVVQPGIMLNGDAAGGTTNRVISASGRRFLWLEGTINATGDNAGVYLVASKHSVLRGLNVSGADTGFTISGIYLSGGSNNKLSNITATDNLEGDGVYIGSSSNNTLIDSTFVNNKTGVSLMFSSNNTLNGITSIDNTQYGVGLTFGSNNKLWNITAANSNYGISVSTENNSWFSNITAVNNNSNGIWLLSDADNNTLSNITAINNGNDGVHIAAKHNLLMNIITANNPLGISLSSADGNTLLNTTATDNTYFGVSVHTSSNNTFTGFLKVGGNGSGDSDNCVVVNLTAVNPGLTATCEPNGSSDHTRVLGVTHSDSFVGKVVSDDANTHGDTGTFAYDEITDWTNFDNRYRAWGKYSAEAFPHADNQQNCITTESCQIWDWSLVATGDEGDNGGPVALEILPPLLDGDNTLEHRWLGTATNQDDCTSLFPGSIFQAENGCQTTLLRRAIEIPSDDGSSNNNSLCESDETCLFTPNIGSYQGHGNLISAGTFTNGTLKNITLLRYEFNGR